MDKKANKTSLAKVKNLAKKNSEFVETYGEALVRLTKSNSGSNPPDLAQQSFWQFLNSTRGVALMEMLSIPGNIKVVNVANVIHR